MANQLAIRVLARPGTEVLCQDRAHVYRYEAAAAPLNSGVQMHPLWGVPDGITAAIEGTAHHMPTAVAARHREHVHGRVGRADCGRRDATAVRTRPRRRAARCTSTARGSGTPRSRSRRRRRELVRRRRHRDVLPLEGLARARSVRCCADRPPRSPKPVRTARASAAGCARPGSSRPRGSSRSRRWSSGSPTITCARAVSPRPWPNAGRAASIPDEVRTNIVCAAIDRAARATSSNGSAPQGVQAGTIDPRTVRFVTHKDVDDDAHRAHDQGLRRAWRRADVLDTDVPERVLAVYAHPDDPEISAGGTLARWADAGAEVHIVVTTRGDKGTNDPDADLDALARLRVDGDGGRGAGARRHRAATISTIPTASSPTTATLRLELVRLVRDDPPRCRVLPRSDRGVLRRRLRQPPRPPRHRLGDARRGRARGRESALLPRAARRGTRRASRARGVPVGHARTERRGSTSPRRSNARSRRCSATRASWSRPATGFASSCARARSPRGVPRASRTPRRSAGSSSGSRHRCVGAWARHSDWARITQDRDDPGADRGHDRSDERGDQQRATCTTPRGRESRAPCSSRRSAGVGVSAHDARDHGVPDEAAERRRQPRCRRTSARAPGVGADWDARESGPTRAGSYKRETDGR